jgi:hypothetical protein
MTGNRSLYEMAEKYPLSNRKGAIAPRIFFWFCGIKLLWPASTVELRQQSVRMKLRLESSNSRTKPTSHRGGNRQSTYMHHDNAYRVERLNVSLRHSGLQARAATGSQPSTSKSDLHTDGNGEHHGAVWDIVPGAGNHPYVARSTSSSSVRPTCTSTSSACSASLWRAAPSVPGPRDEILPADDTTRCHGTGGSAAGERNLSAVIMMAH